jgi:hypothetical protein
MVQQAKGTDCPCNEDGHQHNVQQQTLSRCSLMPTRMDSIDVDDRTQCTPEVILVVHARLPRSRRVG